jgi:hypothetical protein
LQLLVVLELGLSADGVHGRSVGIARSDYVVRVLWNIRDDGIEKGRLGDSCLQSGRKALQYSLDQVCDIQAFLYSIGFKQLFHM